MWCFTTVSERLRTSATGHCPLEPMHAPTLEKNHPIFDIELVETA